MRRGEEEGNSHEEEGAGGFGLRHPSADFGSQVRGQIPTTYDPENPPMPMPPTPGGLSAGTGPGPEEVTGVCLPNAITAEYQWALTLTGFTPEVQSQTTTVNQVTFTGIASGYTGTLTVTAINAMGSSAPTEPAAVST